MSINIKSFNAGQHIIDRGDSDKVMYIIQEGKVEVLIQDEVSKKEIQLSILSKNDFFGELALLFGKERNANVIALTDVVVFIIDSREQLVEYIKKNPEFAMGMLMILANRVEKMTEVYIETKGNLEFAKKIIGESLKLNKWFFV